jgi:hypothetical protein
MSISRKTAALIAASGLTMSAGAYAYNHNYAQACNKLPLGLHANCAVTHAFTNFLMSAANAADNLEY